MIESGNLPKVRIGWFLHPTSSSAAVIGIVSSSLSIVISIHLWLNGSALIGLCIIMPRKPLGVGRTLILDYLTFAMTMMLSYLWIRIFIGKSGIYATDVRTWVKMIFP